MRGRIQPAQDEWGSTMGFRPERTVYNLNFSGTYLDGLTVKIRACTIREFNWMQEPVEGVDFTKEQSKMTTAERMQVRDLVAKSNTQMEELLLKYLVEWDLEDEQGNPVPKTLEGFESQEAGFSGLLITAWQKAMSTVPDPLERPSSSGETSEERSLAMETSSPNPENWPEQSS